jgi:hypothetical protein
VRGEALRRESGVSAKGVVGGLSYMPSPMQDGYTSTWDFTKLLSLSPAIPHILLWAMRPTVTSAPGVAQQGGNVFLRDWDVKILAAGSDAAVIPGLLRGFRHFLSTVTS